MEEAPAFQNKTLSVDAALRRTFGRQRIWLVVGLMASAMLLMCTSVALLQRRFDLAGYFRPTPAAAAAAAAENIERQPANGSERRREELERELRAVGGKTMSHTHLRTRLPKQLKSRRRVRGKAGKPRWDSTTKPTAAAHRERPGGYARRRFRETTPINISHELEILQGSFAAKPLEIDAPETTEGPDSNHDRHGRTVSTDTTLMSRVDQETSSQKGPVKISVESHLSSNSTPQPTKAAVKTTAIKKYPRPTLMATGSVVVYFPPSTSERRMKEEKTRSLSIPPASVSLANNTVQKHIRMLKKRRRLRIRVTVPASRAHSSFRNQRVPSHENVTIMLTTKNAFGKEATPKKGVYEAPHVLKNFKSNLSSRMSLLSSSSGHSTTKDAKTTIDSFGEVSLAHILVKQSTLSQGNEIMHITLTNENMSENITAVFATQKSAAFEGKTVNSLGSSIEKVTASDIKTQNFTISEKPLSPLPKPHVSSTSNVVSGVTNLGKPEAEISPAEVPTEAPALARSDGKEFATLTPQNGTATVLTMQGVVSSTAQTMSTKQNTSLSSESSLDVNASPQLASVSFTRAGVHDTGNEQPRLPEYNETLSSDVNSLVDVVVEGANKTADEVLNKILQKISSQPEISENVTRHRDGGSEESLKQSGESGRITWDDLGNHENSSGNVTPAAVSEPSQEYSRTLVSTSVSEYSYSPVQMTMATPLVKDVSTPQPVAKEPVTKEASTHELTEMNSSGRTSSSSTASTSQEPVEEVVPLAKATPREPPDEIVPEAAPAPEVHSPETILPETTTAPTFAYYTGKDEWIPEENAQFIDKTGNYGKKLHGHFQRKAALSHDHLGSKKEWPASVDLSYRFAGTAESDAHDNDKSKGSHTQEGAPEGTVDNQHSDEEAGKEREMGDLYSSLKSAVHDESKNRLTAESGDMLDYGIQQHESSNEVDLDTKHGDFIAGGAAAQKSSQEDGKGAIRSVADLTYVEERSSENIRWFAHSKEYGQTQEPNKSLASPEPFVISSSNEDGVRQNTDTRAASNKPESPKVAVAFILTDTTKQPKRVGALTSPQGTNITKRSAGPVQSMPEDDSSFTTSFIRQSRDGVNTSIRKDELEKSLEPKSVPENERPSVESENEYFNAAKEIKLSSKQKQPPGLNTDMTEKTYSRIENNVDWSSTLDRREDAIASTETKSSLLNDDITKNRKTETPAFPRRFSEPIVPGIANTEGTVVTAKKTSLETLTPSRDVRRPGVLCVYRRSHAGWKSANMSYSLESVPYEYCSSVLYCCLGLRHDLAIEDIEDNTDFKYLATVKTLNPGLEAYVVIESNGSSAVFQELLSKSVHQDIFLLLAVHWMKARKIDGTYLYWRDIHDKDGDELTKLYHYFHDSFDKSKLKFGVILPPGTQHFAKAPALKSLTDDLGGTSSRILLAPPEMEDSAFVSTISDHAEFLAKEYNRYPKDVAGASSSICPMIPFWGKAFKMQAVIKDTGLTLKPVGRGRPRAITQEPGKLAFFEFCRELGNSLFVFPTREHVMKGDEYMTFLTPVSLEKYLSSMVSHSSWRCFGSWGPEWDDFSGQCGMGRFPLLRTLYEFEVNSTLNVPAASGTSEVVDS